MTIEEKKERIIKKEWNFFQQVENEGGRASCQEDPETFFIMRRSQFCAWPEELLNSYEADLTEAAAAGRNPLAEKYLRAEELLKVFAHKYPASELYIHLEGRCV